MAKQESKWINRKYLNVDYFEDGFVDVRGANAKGFCACGREWKHELPYCKLCDVCYDNQMMAEEENEIWFPFLAKKE